MGLPGVRTVEGPGSSRLVALVKPGAVEMLGAVETATT